jgi:hypothetical protein
MANHDRETLTSWAKDLYRIQQESAEKYAYFLLAAAGSAIAYVVGVTLNRSASWTLFAVIAAILLWMLSFYHGCRWIEAINKQRSGAFQIAGVGLIAHMQDPAQIAETVNAINERAVAVNADVMRHQKRQLQYLLFGVVAFGFWFAIETIPQIWHRSATRSELVPPGTIR